jgi:hypothetical protein
LEEDGDSVENSDNSDFGEMEDDTDQFVNFDWSSIRKKEQDKMTGSSTKLFFFSLLRQMGDESKPSIGLSRTDKMLKSSKKK